MSRRDDLQRLARRAAAGDISAARRLVGLLEAGHDPDPVSDPVGWLVWQHAEGRLGPAAIRMLRVAKYAEGYEEVVERVAGALISEWQADHPGEWPSDAAEVGTPEEFRREFRDAVRQAARTLGQCVDEVFDLPSRDEGSNEDLGEAVAHAVERQSRSAVSTAAADVRRKVAAFIAAGPRRRTP